MRPVSRRSVCLFIENTLNRLKSTLGTFSCRIFMRHTFREKRENIIQSIYTYIYIYKYKHIYIYIYDLFALRWRRWQLRTNAKPKFSFSIFVRGSVRLCFWTAVLSVAPLFRKMLARKSNDRPNRICTSKTQPPQTLERRIRSTSGACQGNAFSNKWAHQKSKFLILGVVQKNARTKWFATWRVRSLPPRRGSSSEEQHQIRRTIWNLNLVRGSPLLWSERCKHWCAWCVDVQCEATTRSALPILGHRV